MLYLLELNFTELSNTMKERLNEHENKDRTMDYLFTKYRNDPLQFVFALVLSKDRKDDKAFEKIKNNLHKKLKNICLVAKNFPSEERNYFSEQGNFLLDSLYKLCNPEKKYRIQFFLTFYCLNAVFPNLLTWVYSYIWSRCWLQKIYFFSFIWLKYATR